MNCAFAVLVSALLWAVSVASSVLRAKSGTNDTTGPYSKTSSNTHFLDEHNQTRFAEEDAILQQYQSIPNSYLWKAHNVTERMPFLFMHQRKAGGTSLRCTLHTATNTSNITSFIPCYDGVDCRIFNVPLSPPYAVYALHTTWDELDALVRQRGTSSESERNLTYFGTLSRPLPNSIHHEANLNLSQSDTLAIQQTSLVAGTDCSTVSEKPKFSCLTNFREPVSRLVSCLYFRFSTYFLNRHWSCINDLSVARMTKLLVEKVDPYNNSCLNEPFRVLGPINDEKMVTSLGYDYNDTSYEVGARLGELELSTLNATLRNLQHCVPIVLEIPQSRRLLKVAFPSLHAKNAFDHGVREQLGYNYSANCTAPTAAHMQVLHQLTAFESVLYRAVVKKVHSALREFNLTASTKHNHRVSHTKHHANFSAPLHVNDPSNSSVQHNVHLFRGSNANQTSSAHLRRHGSNSVTPKME